MFAKTLYFDESGFTGYNLLDDRQPVFAIASVDLDAGFSEALLRDAFPRYKGDEFKFSKLWRSKVNRGQFPEFGRLMNLHFDRAFIWRVDKRFAVLTKLIDFLVEPIVQDAGFDFYAGGFSLNFANYVHFGLANIVSNSMHKRLLQSYQNFSRNPSILTLELLEKDLTHIAENSDDRMKGIFDLMVTGTQRFTEYYNIENFKGSDELQLTRVSIVGHWRNLCEEDFRIVHDESSNFFHRMDHWNRITNSNVPEQSHPAASGMLYQFPLRVISTEPVDSKENGSIQLCDILAGLAARGFAPNVSSADRDILESTIEAGLGQITVSGIAPEPFDPDRLEPARRQGPDVVDRMVEIMFGQHNNSIKDENQR